MNVLFVSFELFPYGSAPSFRAYTLSKLIAEAGNTVTVLTRRLNFEEGELSNNGICEACPSIRAISIEDYSNSYEIAMEETMKRERFDVVLRPTSMKHFYRIKRLCNKAKLPVVMDSVEWFDPSNWRLERFDPRYYFFQHLWHNEFIKADGIIAISRLIETYYRKHVLNVVRIPTITDSQNMRYRDSVDKNDIHCVFAGQLDKGKDKLVNFILAMKRVNNTNQRIYLDIYGPSEEAVLEEIGEHKRLIYEMKSQIHIHGRVNQKEMHKICLESDYSVFFRQNRRSANAGFPTKLGECMTMGTPAFCNDTGDISLVMKNGVNGFMIDSGDVDAIYKTLCTILEMSIEERAQMRKAARESAELFFDYHNYIKEIQQVLQCAVAGEKKNGAI